MPADAFYDDFAEALRSGDTKTILPHLDTAASAARFAVYRNNVVRGAIDALRAAYPAVERLVGADFFASLARAYWDIFPPRQPSLSLYGSGFADFVCTYAPASDLPWLADVARHDRAWLEAHHECEAPVFGAASAAALDPERLAGLATGLHPSVRLLVSGWPAYEIWRRNRFDPEPAPLTAVPGAWFTIVWRRRGEVRHRALELADHAFLLAIRDGRTIGEAAEIALASHAGFDPATAFGAALSDEILKGTAP
ncbi:MULTISPECIES: DNA-binding domain-containing protein [Alphaproteobacteria]|jgi:hypothetical protein|uniref:DUF2063 domain-containing protein n=1 Tax=Maricaulis virginensis TaxID=144022 RepID=A0A9W6IRB2_9PROT|nr:DNA-binding domain-containing protein [Maricaulis virginensis]GLK53934.1 DUF2063 domain-containing protein [Maricaulis virginensis]